MKKIFLLISSLISILAILALPLACSNDDSDDDNYNGGNQILKEVKTFTGTLAYGQLRVDGAKVSIHQEGENISLALENTQIPYLSPEFKDVNVNVSGDTSYFRAQSETIDAGSDMQLVLVLNGMMFNDCETLYMTVTGSGMTDTLYFATDKDMLPNRSKVDVDGPTNGFPDYELNGPLLLNAIPADLLGNWEGTVKYDGEESGTISFATSLGGNGLSVDLGHCKFSEKAPEMDIVLTDMMVFVASEGTTFLKGKTANYKLGGLSGNLEADINGSVSENNEISLGLSITVMKKDHTIEIANAKRKD